MSAPTRRRRRASASTIAFRPPARRLIAAVGISFILALVSYTGLRAYTVLSRISGHGSLGDVIGLAQNQDDSPGTLAYKIHHGERTNILLMGYGGPSHDGPYLTDSIMMVSVQGPDRVALTSVPRDTYVGIPAFSNGGAYQGKINAAYEIPLSNGAFGDVKSDYPADYNGAGKLASEVIGNYLGVHIDYWVGIDFTAFQKVVDAVGGIDVNNPYALDDWEYPDGDTGGTIHIHFDAGPQHLNGSRALIYVRERHADDDFGRSRRQQQVIAAVKDKALSVGAVPQLFSLLDALQENVHTNLSLNDMKVASGILNKINTETTHHVSIDHANWQYDTLDPTAGYILLARDRTLDSLHRFIVNELPDPAVLAENANVQFASTHGQASAGNGIAQIMGSAIGMIGFKTMAPATAKAAPAVTEVHDYSGGKDARTAQWMADYFGGTVVTEDPANRPSPAAAGSPTPGASSSPGVSDAPSIPPDIVVVLGDDFTTNFDRAERAIYSPPPADYRAPSQLPHKVLPTQAPEPSQAPIGVPSQAPLPTPKPKGSPKP